MADNTVDERGAVKVYEWNGFSWVNNFNVTGEYSEDGFGVSVSFNVNGNILLLRPFIIHLTPICLIHLNRGM